MTSPVDDNTKTAHKNRKRKMSNEASRIGPPLQNGGPPHSDGRASVMSYVSRVVKEDEISTNQLGKQRIPSPIPNIVISNVDDDNVNKVNKKKKNKKSKTKRDKR